MNRALLVKKNRAFFGGCKGRGARAFLLFEVMLGVAIFAIGIIALGQAVNNCMLAEAARKDDQRARMALQSEMAQIEADMVKLTDAARTLELDAPFDGITIKETRTPANLKGENNQAVNGIYTITIEATWKRGSEPQSKSVSFYGR